MNDSNRADLLALPVEERLLLVMEIWDSIADDAASIPVDPAFLAEVERRVAAYRNNPGELQAWTEVREDMNRRFVARDEP